MWAIEALGSNGRGVGSLQKPRTCAGLNHLQLVVAQLLLPCSVCVLCAVLSVNY